MFIYIHIVNEFVNLMLGYSLRIVKLNIRAKCLSEISLRLLYHNSSMPYLFCLHLFFQYCIFAAFIYPQCLQNISICYLEFKSLKYVNICAFFVQTFTLYSDLNLQYDVEDDSEIIRYEKYGLILNIKKTKGMVCKIVNYVLIQAIQKGFKE